VVVVVHRCRRHRRVVIHLHRHVTGRVGGGPGHLTRTGGEGVQRGMKGEGGAHPSMTGEEARVEEGTLTGMTGGEAGMTEGMEEEVEGVGVITGRVVEVVGMGVEGMRVAVHPLVMLRLPLLVVATPALSTHLLHRRRGMEGQHRRRPVEGIIEQAVEWRGEEMSVSQRLGWVKVRGDVRCIVCEAAGRVLMWHTSNGRMMDWTGVGLNKVRFITERSVPHISSLLYLRYNLRHLCGVLRVQGLTPTDSRRCRGRCEQDSGARCEGG
jgi:hypothetical protein